MIYRFPDSFHSVFFIVVLLDYKIFDAGAFSKISHYLLIVHVKYAIPFHMGYKADYFISKMTDDRAINVWLTFSKRWWCNSSQ